MKTTPHPRSVLCRATLVALLPSVLVAQSVVQLETFTVSAQKRVQSVADVPVPITVYTGSFLERAGVTDFKSLAPLVPGLFIQEQSPNNPGINLRGITTDSGDPRAETRISIFQDGVSIGRSRASVVELFDLERVEILKGPQGTLFGRGAEIGAISFVQNKAKNEATGELTLGFGDFNERRASGQVNAVIAKDELFARFAFAYREHDGVIDNLADGSTLNGKKTLALRGALRWQPTPTTTADLLVNWQHDTPPGVAFVSGVIPNSRGSTSPFAAAELNRGSKLGIDRTVGGVTAIVAHEFSKNVSLTSITGWRQYDSYENFDADGSRLPLLEFAEDSRGRQFSQEVRVNFNDGGRFTAFAGAGWFSESGVSRVPFYQDERQLWPFLAGSFRDGLIGGGLPTSLANAFVPPASPFTPQAALPLAFAGFATPGLPASLRPLAGLAGAPLRPSRTDDYTQSGRTRAFDVFVDGTWRATDQLEFTAGLRLTHEKLTSGYEVRNDAAFQTLGFIVNSIPGYPFLPSGGKREASASSSSWDGRLIGRYEFSKTLNAYTSVSRGHRPRALLLDSTTTTTAREETVMNYEAGLKGSLAAGRVQWNASVYHYDYAHFQTTVQSLGRFTTLDAGNATGRGLEAGVQGRVADSITLFANAALTRATFDDTGDNGARQQYAGYTFRLTPRRTVSLGGTFTLPLEGAGQIFVTPIWSYKSQHYFEDNNASFGYGLRQDGYGVANLRVGWRSPKSRWEITARAENLFDKQYLIDAGNTGGSFGIPTFIAGDPRRVGVQATLRW
ncbi:MAG: TonB-dependent receptor [Opitutaceae bacterium]|nr:TonB-dependent receptor [Opitutaceae bacterium]